MDMRHEIILGATCDILTLVTWDNLVFKIDIRRMGPPAWAPISLCHWITRLYNVVKACWSTLTLCPILTQKVGCVKNKLGQSVSCNISLPNILTVTSVPTKQQDPPSSRQSCCWLSINRLPWQLFFSGWGDGALFQASVILRASVVDYISRATAHRLALPELLTVYLRLKVTSAWMVAGAFLIKISIRQF